MNTLISRYALPKLVILLISALLAFQPAAFAQNDARPVFSQQELDQMLAPIALYPDPLLSQLLMASTYPLEVVEAARWSRAHPNLRGDGAVRAAADRDWDPSVKSLVAFPQILAMMDQKLDWTERLGDAFLAQESQVMDTVQDLRHRAYAAGNLRSNDEYRVESQGGYIDIEPANPQIVYLPYYNPLVVYGSWWWPAYQPVYWAPWPGYYTRPGFAGFAWGAGFGVSAGFFFGNFDWHQHQARVVNVNNFYYNRTVVVNREGIRTNATRSAPGAWQHDPAHRRGAPYHIAALNEKFSSAPDARRANREREMSARPDRHSAVAPPARRDTAAPAASRPQVRETERRPDTRTAAVPEERSREVRIATAPNRSEAVRRDMTTNAGRADPPSTSRPPPERPRAEEPRRAPSPPTQAMAPSPPQVAPAPPDRRPPGKGGPAPGKAHEESDKGHEKK